MTPMREKLALKEQMLAAFQKAAQERPKRREFIKVGTSSLPAWVVYEREQMLIAVNQERAERGLPPVDLRSVALADRCASGHVDYASKYALYCTEIALGENQPQP